MNVDSSITGCGRNYCNPTLPQCGNSENRNVTWFFTEERHFVFCGDRRERKAQNYCDQNASSYGGGSYVAVCSGDVDTANNYICVRDFKDGGFPEGDFDSNNKLPCCLGSINDASSCAPNWCPSQLSDCRDVLSTHCSLPNNAGTDPVCINFCSLSENKRFCDQPMRKYCEENPKKQICSCISSRIPRPSCFDVVCTEQGYQTAEMLSDATMCGVFCADFINCVAQGTCTIQNNEFIEKCGQPVPTPSGNGGTALGIPLWVWIGGGILLIIILGIISYFLFF